MKGTSMIFLNSKSSKQIYQHRIKNTGIRIHSQSRKTRHLVWSCSWEKAPWDSQLSKNDFRTIKHTVGYPRSNSQDTEILQQGIGWDKFW